MRHLIATVGVVIWMMALAGCSRKPPPEIDAAVRERLTRYSQAWERGDAAGVRESFHARDADEAALVDALSELAPAQARLRATYRDSLGTIGRIIFGDADPATLVYAPRDWDAFARAAASPQRLIYKKPRVIARLDEEDEDLTFHVRNVDGGDWKLDAAAFLMGDDAQRLAAATRRQVAHTKEMIDAMQSGDPSRVRQVVLRQVVEVRGPGQSRVLDDILRAPATTRATTRANATRANATRANATRANATRANATRANATPANATRANVTRANATRANVTRAKENPP